MRFGAGLGLMTGGKNPDHVLYRHGLETIEDIERLGFDSIWTVEHHFTGHSPVPNSLQMLSFVAAKTSTVMLGTAVLTLPWHHPIRVAEEIAVLDLLSGGRTLIGFGRGVSTGEYAGFGVPIEESRERFAEAAQIVMLGLTRERFSFDGRFFRIPEIAIRPRPLHAPERRLYGAATSPASFDLMAELGLGLLLSPARDLGPMSALARRYRGRCAGATSLPAPICHLYVSVDTREEDAHARAEQYMLPMIRMLDRHYGISSDNLARVGGYEQYARPSAGDVRKDAWWDLADPREAVRSFKNRHLVGTPEQCIARIAQIREALGVEHFVGEFSYGDMPPAESRANMELFARAVAPAVRATA